MAEFINPFNGFVEVKVTGLKELESALNKLPEKVARRILQKAAKKGIEIMQKEAISNAPSRTGALKRGIKTQVRTKGEGTRGATVIWKLGLVNKPKASSVYYGRFLENGTKAHDIKTRKAAVLSNGTIILGRKVHVSGVRGIGFFERAFNTEKQAAIDIFRLELADGIDMAVAEAKR